MIDHYTTRLSNPPILSLFIIIVERFAQEKLRFFNKCAYVVPFFRQFPTDPVVFGFSSAQDDEAHIAQSVYFVTYVAVVRINLLYVARAHGSAPAHQKDDADRVPVHQEFTRQFGHVNPMVHDSFRRPRMIANPPAPNLFWLFLQPSVYVQPLPSPGR